MNKTFTPSGLTWNDLEPNMTVNVHRKDDADQFIHGFVGTVIDKNALYIIVEDQDGDCFTVDPDQCSYNTDDIMHS